MADSPLIEALGETLELPTAELASLVGVSVRTIQRWKAGGNAWASNADKVEALQPPPPIGSHVLIQMATRSPAHAFTASRHLNPSYVEERATKFDLGTIAHRLILERDLGDTRLQVFDWPDWINRKITIEAPGGVAFQVMKAELRKACYKAGLIPILKGQYDESLEMAEVVRRRIAEYPEVHTVGDRTEGEPEVSISWAVRDGDNRPVICRGRVDWLDVARGFFVDLKTTARDAEAESYSRTQLWWDIAIQLAFYAWGLKLIHGKPFKPYIVAAENKPPFATSVIEVPKTYLEAAQTMVVGAVRRYRQCWEDGQWPAYPAEIHSASPPAYKLPEAGMTDTRL